MLVVFFPQCIPPQNLLLALVMNIPEYEEKVNSKIPTLYLSWAEEVSVSLTRGFFSCMMVGKPSSNPTLLNLTKYHDIMTS